MSDSAVQNENDTAMSQNPRFLHRQLEIVQLLEAEFSDYSCLEERFREMSDSRRELEEQLSAKDEDVIRWKTAYTQCYSKLCQLLEKNWQADEECQQLREECQQLREECQQLSEENMVLSYLSEGTSSPIHLDNFAHKNRQAYVLNTRLSTVEEEQDEVQSNQETNIQIYLDDPATKN